MKLSFIILNYRSEKYLEVCIDSIFKKITETEFEVIVVNNDEKKIEIKKIDCNNIKIVEINKNIGFAKGNNRGAKISVGEYLCFINPDAKIVSNNIERVLEEFEKNSTVGIIGPKILKRGRAQEWSVGADLKLIEILRGKMGLAKSEKFWNSSKKIEVDWVSGVSLFIKKSIFTKIGGFDEHFFLYYEDVDLCRRVRDLNKKVIYCPFFEVSHVEGSSSSNKYNQKVQYFKSQDYYYKKWFSFKEYYVLKFFRFFYLLGYRIRHDQ